MLTVHSISPMSSQIIRHRVGGWLPQDQAVLEAWIEKKLAIINHPDRKDKVLHPVIQEFQELIENDADVWMGFHQMFEQVPTKPPYNLDPTKKPQVGDFLVINNLCV
jgi:phosphatidylserine decarboxylase